MNISALWIRVVTVLAVLSGAIAIGLPVGALWKYPESYSTVVPYARAALLCMIGSASALVILGTIRTTWGGHKNWFS